jgi:DNA-binding CsgD family transcriptional regulator
MQRPATPFERSFKGSRDLVIMLGLLFFTWYLAALSVHPLDIYFVVSVVPGICVAVWAVRLWINLQHERGLRRQAEAMLRSAPLPATPRSEPSTGSEAIQVNLTEREREVLSLIASSCSNQGVAEVLNISLNTVERHIANIYRKLGVHGRVEATHYAVRQGLVSEESLDRCREVNAEGSRDQG